MVRFLQGVVITVAGNVILEVILPERNIPSDLTDLIQSMEVHKQMHGDLAQNISELEVGGFKVLSTTSSLSSILRVFLVGKLSIPNVTMVPLLEQLLRRIEDERRVIILNEEFTKLAIDMDLKNKLLSVLKRTEKQLLQKEEERLQGIDAEVSRPKVKRIDEH